MTLHPPPTARLRFSAWQPQDAPELHRILGHAETMRFWPAPFDLPAAQAWIQRSQDSIAQHHYGRWRVALHDGTTIGDAGLFHVEVNGQPEHDLGYIIHSAHQRQGYGLEAAIACRDFALRHLGLTRIVCNMPADHTASRRVAEHLGMHLACQFINHRNRSIETCLYVLEP